MSSFPASKYARYKRATAFFLDWLLRAQGLGRYVGQRMKLDAISDVVRDIALEPSVLTPKLSQSFPKALAACQCSITLREHVAKFFFEDDEAAERASSPFKSVEELARHAEDHGGSGRLEVVCLFLELEELVEGVFTIDDEVKMEKRTMVEATLAVKVAMDAANELTARLQLKYPALKTAEDVGVVLMDNLPKNFWSEASTALGEFWMNFATTGTYTFVPGIIVVEFRSMLSTLGSFTTGIPTKATHGMVLREGFFGETYGEERMQGYVLPDASNMVIFLLQQLPHLYNAILDMKPVQQGSVAALQGNAGLSRNVGVTIKHWTDLVERIKATAAKRAVSGDVMARGLLRQCDQQIQQVSRSHHLARANP
ncbi:hypothetical protein PHYPSEUDO_000739 [Phytophthora pseudosyringae]|uniref:Uncharacterized protein n=1 Tax=Phytophthora pseudosyringae TaxID=221518 RepID=A0A8T1V3N6_9STRA|nr:hypothetical protein PHYPSEUDO_000739 [Phytophthora pseudosyringae]